MKSRSSARWSQRTRAEPSINLAPKISLWLQRGMSRDGDCFRGILSPPHNNTGRSIPHPQPLFRCTNMNSQRSRSPDHHSVVEPRAAGCCHNKGKKQRAEIFQRKSTKQIATAADSEANVAVIHLSLALEIGRVFVGRKRHRRRRRQSTFHFCISIYLIHAITR